MKVIKLVSENIKGLKAVEIYPDETLQIISGKNGQGKSSVMDSIWLALGGSDAIKHSNTVKAIREGQEKAQVTLDLGDLIVTRRWTSNDRSSLKVQSKDGSSFKSPQSLLNSLIGRMSFDPLSFSNMDSKEQIELLINTAELERNPQDIDDEKKEIFSNRTIVNREVKKLKTIIENLPEIPEDTPDEKISQSDIVNELQKAHEHNAQLNQLTSQASQIELNVKSELQRAEMSKNKIAKIDEEIENLNKLREQTVEHITTINQTVNSLNERLNETNERIKTFEKIDTDQLNNKLNKSEEINKNVENKIKKQNLEAEFEEKSNESQSMTDQIKNLENEKQQIFDNANFPIDGLTFDENEVLYQGVPLKQCSSAERLKVSMSIAMSLNPELRIIRIMDGSLLDSENLKLIKDMAQEKDYQIWVEQVDESGQVGIVIEDGEIKKNNDGSQLTTNTNEEIEIRF